MAIVNAACMTVSGAPGTGTVTLGSPVASFLSFSDAGCVDGQTYSYVLTDGSSREGGTGTYDSGGTFTRDTVAYSTAGGTTKIDAGASAVIAITALAADIGGGGGGDLVKIDSGSISSPVTFSPAILLSGAYSFYQLCMTNLVFSFYDDGFSNYLHCQMSFDGGDTWVQDSSNADAYIWPGEFPDNSIPLSDYDSNEGVAYLSSILIHPGSNSVYASVAGFGNQVYKPTVPIGVGGSINPNATVPISPARVTAIRLLPYSSLSDPPSATIDSLDWTLYGVN